MMTTMEETNPANANPEPGGVGSQSLPWIHFKATLLVVAEFIALQLVAIGMTTGIYSLIPFLDAGFERNFNHWMRAFQILSPTLTISGGAAIVLSSYIFHKIAQEAQQRAAQAEKHAAETEKRAAETEKRAAEERKLIAEERRRIAEEERRIAEEEKRAAEERAARAEADIGELRTELAELRAQLAERPPRRRRRSLR